MDLSSAAEWISAIAQVSTVVVLVRAAIAGRKQLEIIREQNDARQEQNRTIQEQNDLSRIVEWKSSIQEVNNLILKYPATFRPVLYPPIESDEEVRETTAAYASLNALETIYHMRMRAAESNDERDEIENFLRAYISESGPIKKLWKKKAFHHAFTTEFQEAISKIVNSPSIASGSGTKA